MTGSPAWSESWTRVIRQALCGNSGLDADAWFPVSTHAQSARDEAAAAIAICRACPVRRPCLALSLRHWDVGQYGVWGGLIAADREMLRRRMLARRGSALQPKPPSTRAVSFLLAAGRGEKRRATVSVWHSTY
jgi:Transcription factor WhiB